MDAFPARLGMVIASYRQILSTPGLLSDDRRVEYRARLAALMAEQARRIAVKGTSK